MTLDFTARSPGDRAPAVVRILTKLLEARLQALEKEPGAGVLTNRTEGQWCLASRITRRETPGPGKNI